MPPVELRRRVGGIEDPTLFRRAGRAIASDLLTVLNRAGVQLDPQWRVADFGCGCGRVLVEFASQSGVRDLVGTDVDAEAIGWYRETLSQSAEFVVNQDRPPLPLESGSIDLLYAVSVFTHLARARQEA